MFRKTGSSWLLRKDLWAGLFSVKILVFDVRQ